MAFFYTEKLLFASTIVQQIPGM